MNLEDHRLLGETGPGTRMGALLRRYWTPAILSTEVEAGGAPIRVRLLAEDLVAFRNPDGHVGLMAEHCSHRGASLFFAKNDGCGLRCWYHGWAYDRDGNCIDMPNEPPQSQFKERVKHPAYPCVEKNGVVWTYMGPPETQPGMPEFEWLTLPESHIHVSKRIQRCHWTQGLEGDIDSSHLGFLHGHAIPLAITPDANRRIGSGAPSFELHHTRAGIVQAARRHVDDTQDYLRIGQWLMPGVTTIPPRGGDDPLHGHSWTPADDGSTWVFVFSWHPARPFTEEEHQIMATASNFHVHLVPGTFEPAHRANEYAAPGWENESQPWMRIKYFQDQDMCMTESMGPLYDRTQEHLGNSDLVVTRTRGRLIEAARELARGIEPPGREPADFRLRPVSVLLAKSVKDWAAACAEAMDARPGTYRQSI